MWRRGGALFNKRPPPPEFAIVERRDMAEGRPMWSGPSVVTEPQPNAGPLPLPHYLKPGPAVRCISPPEFPFRFIWVLGWPTRCLCANDPTPCTCNTNYLHVLMLSNIFFHPRRSFASSCHSGTCNSLNSGFTRRTSLRSTAASSATSAESSANSPSSSHRPSSTPLLLLLVAYCVDAGVTRRRARPLRLSPSVCTCGGGGGGPGGGGATCSGRCR